MTGVVTGVVPGVVTGVGRAFWAAPATGVTPTVVRTTLFANGEAAEAMGLPGCLGDGIANATRKGCSRGGFAEGTSWPRNAR